MASRRLLKKSIKNISSELFNDCILLHCTHPEKTSRSEELMQEILLLNVEYVKRINHTGKGSERQFYRKLRKEFVEKAIALSKTISEA